MQTLEGVHMPELGKKMMTRRNLIRGAGAGLFGAAGAAVLAACGETQVVEKIVTREVIKEVPVETVVTKEIIKEVPVETVVTRDVIKEVPVETVVTKEVIKEVIKEVPVETEVIKEVVKEVVKEVEVEVEKEVIKEVVVTKEVTVEVEVPAEMTPIPEGPISGGVLTLSASRANTQDIFTQLRQVSSTQAFVTDYVFMPLWYGDTWGMGETPALSGQWAPGVASSWDEVEKNRVYNFHLNPDVAWHDGAPLTISDVLFGIEMAFDTNYNNNKHKTDMGDIDGAKAWGDNPTDSAADMAGVSVIDEMTIQIAIEKPDPDWWAAGSKVFPMARHHYAGLDKAIATEARAVDLLGNGPMIWERYVTQQFVDLAANKAFAYGAPYVADYIVRYGDGSALDAAAEANEQPNPIDFHRAAGGTEAFQRLASQPHLRPFPQRSPFGSHVFFNQTAEVFADMTLDAAVAGDRGHGPGGRSRDHEQRAVRRHALHLGLHLRAHRAAAGPAGGHLPRPVLQRRRGAGADRRGRVGHEQGHPVDQVGPADAHRSRAQGRVGHHWRPDELHARRRFSCDREAVPRARARHGHGEHGRLPERLGRVPARVQRPGLRAGWLEPLEHQPPVDR